MRHAEFTIIVFILLTFCTAQISLSEDGPPPIHNGEELLTAINERMGDMDLPQFTHDSLIVCLATEADVGHRIDGKLDGRVEGLIKSLIKRKRFKVPLRLGGGYRSRVPLEDGKYDKYINLPAHDVLELRILNRPWGSRNAEGQPLKITWISIVIASKLRSDSSNSKAHQKKRIFGKK